MTERSVGSEKGSSDGTLRTAKSTLACWQCHIARHDRFQGRPTGVKKRMAVRDTGPKPLLGANQKRVLLRQSRNTHEYLTVAVQRTSNRHARLPKSAWMLTGSVLRETEPLRILVERGGGRHDPLCSTAFKSVHPDVSFCGNRGAESIYKPIAQSPSSCGKDVQTR